MRPSRRMLRQAARHPRLRRAVRGAIERLPVGRQAVVGAARGIEGLIFRADRVPDAARAGRAIPRTYRISPPPASVARDWPVAPLVDDPVKPIRYAPADPVVPPPAAFDIDLLEALNEEYASKPVVPEPPGRDAEARSDKARARLDSLHESIGLAGQRVLEFGCGAGYEVWYLAHHFDADATGVDIVERRAWSVLADERTHFLLADLAVSSPFPENHFDRILSFSVFEHVRHPAAALRELHRILRPGGLAFISANLHQGPMASHLYHDLYFPWPHLLFQDDVIHEYFRRRGRNVAGASWVNRLTWAQYEQQFRAVGFEIVALRFSESPMDEAFFRRFESELGRYARWDLTRNFFHVVARKPG